MAWFSRRTPRPAAPAAPAHLAGTPHDAPAPPRVVTRKDAGPGPSPHDAPAEARIAQIGAELLTRARAHRAGVLSSQFYSDALMNWSMKDPAFKVQLFRFVDAFPTLRGTDDIYDHLRDSLSQPGVSVPAVISTAIAAGSIAKGLAVSQISKQITGMAQKFIAGTDAASALPSLRAMWDDGIAFSVDLLGEACVSDDEADHYQRKYLDLIENLPAQVAAWPAAPRLESDHLGPIPRTNVSVKVSALSPRADPIDAPGATADLLRRLEPILESARDRGVFVNFDMEQEHLKDLTLDLFFRAAERIDFHAGLAMQAYLRSGPDDARRVCDWAARRRRRLTVRLVKGAYWDYHVVHSEMAGWPCPVWTRKRHTDACFETMAQVFLSATPPTPAAAAAAGGVTLALGSHNARSIAAAVAGLDRRGLPRSALELQMLHGMADQLKHAAAEMGLRVRQYVPVGQMIPGMAYLVRRLLENTSNESWLKAGFLDNADPARLLASPFVHPPAPSHTHPGAPAGPLNGSAKPHDPLTPLDPDAVADLSAPERHALSPAVEGLDDGRPFANEPLRDFSKPDQHAAFAAAVAAARPEPIDHAATTPADAARAVQRAADAFPLWRDADPLRRSRALVAAAESLRRRRDHLAAVMIRESGKTWREADADVAEAIDFCQFYARLAPQLFARRRLGRFIGELDEALFQPRGVAAVISPWNFPLAICTGMTAAALVTGNTVVLKPAEQTPATAKALFDALDAALRHQLQSKTQAVLQFLPGLGHTVGAALVRDPRVAIIAFTGSRDVGLDILHAAAPASPFASPTPPAPPHVKKVIAEMGGKNAVIIDTSADPDEAVLGVRHSAFGFQGQKCSACSRAIVVDPDGPDGHHFSTFRDRLVAATRALTIGDPALPGTDIGPVIDADAHAKVSGYIHRAIASGLSHATLPVPAGLPAATGRLYVPPHVFWTVPEDHELAQHEVFGPVLALMHARSFDDALRIANSTDYKLTGGLFSRRPAHIELAKRQFRVGNLYINRGITGALVARQPFGGFGMSGVGSKAGGSDYLLQFVEPRAITENTLRRGFAPEL
ncbi:MAG: L-glutamate gamma-semialdehyde dehydrogenase [Planctomyces sp.]|nr:L-glutamate gamma-semialdehyde dehydrogenase [Planctomyces sp.]MBA4120182.1 L-glutamate gamma-semialdehyde dehydrogenase [Isosphaera sp.]